MANGFKVADAYIDVHADADSVRSTVRDIPGKIGPDADRSGRGLGDRLSEGMRLQFVRNSPLIAAAVAGGLVAGAPLAIAGAGAMFAGIGAVALMHNERLQSSWKGLGTFIKDAAASDAAVLVPTYERMAGRIGQAFEGLRPQIRSAFADSRPLVDSLTEGVVEFAQNAMPGLTRSVGSAGPVFAGLRTFLAESGTGLSKFFDAISSHAPAAGATFAALGSIISSLLPTLGEFMGSGVELASVILPPLASVLKVVASAAASLGPILPMLAAGFGALRIINGVTTMVGGLSGGLTRAAQSMAVASYGSGVLSGAAGGVSNALSASANATGRYVDAVGRAGAALPALGIVVAGIAQTHSNASAKEDQWAQAILGGGRAAVAAQQAYDSGTHWGQSIDEATGLAGSWNDAKGRAAELYAQMTPLQQKQTDLTRATNEAKLAAQQYGVGSAQHVVALQAQDRASADLEREQNSLKGAFNAVTDAMLAQANQALASIDSGFAYRQSVDQLEDAERALNDAVHAHGPASEEARRASLALEQQNFRTASAFAKQQADVSGLKQGTAEYDRLIQEQTLVGLTNLQRKAGPEMAAALQQQIDKLRASGVTLSSTSTEAAGTAARMRDLGLSVTQIPGSRNVAINAPTADQKARIEALGYAVIHLPNGTVVVRADPSGFYRAMDDVTRTRYVTVIQRLQTIPLFGGFGRAMGGPVPGYAGGGLVRGPGGPTADRVPAVGPGGRPMALSDDEWVIKAASSKKYGAKAMAAINAGTAVVAFANGGRVGSAGSAAPAPASGNSYTVNVAVQGLMDLTNQQGMQQLAAVLRDEIRAIERSNS